MSKTIRASDNTRFSLSNDRMTEVTKYRPYYLFRVALQDVLKKNRQTVRYFVTQYAEPDGSLLGWVDHGKSQRGKKFISIGCMRFVGENRTKLIRWAKSAQLKSN